MRKILPILLLLTATAVADPSFPTVTEVIQKEGQLAWSDGSSYYLLEKDGTFKSGPLEMSGRTIQGRWTAADNLVTVQGTWSRINGVSAVNDKRKMVVGLSVSRNFSQDKVSFLPKLKLHKVYFEIEELVKVK